MRYEVADIVRDIKVCLDENSDSEAMIEVSDVDTLTLDEMIRTKIEEAAQRVLLSAPVHVLGGGKDLMEDVEGPAPNKINWHSGKWWGFITLPDYFLRLLVFRMSDWERSVFTAIDGGDPQYLLQKSRVAGIRGNSQRPVVAIVPGDEGGSVLEFYGCKSQEAEVSTARYLKIPKIETETEEEEAVDVIDIPQRVYRAVVYYAAGLVAMSCGESDKMTGLLEMSKKMLM